VVSFAPQAAATADGSEEAQTLHSVPELSQKHTAGSRTALAELLTSVWMVLMASLHARDLTCVRNGRIREHQTTARAKLGFLTSAGPGNLRSRSWFGAYAL
jgi:hypothetical protein